MINDWMFWLVLAVSVALYWALPQRFRMGFLAAASFGYLLTLEWVSVVMLAGWSLLFYRLAPLAAGGGSGLRSRILPGLVLLILGYLAIFKYLPPLLAALAPGTVTARVMIPLGISYFTFKLIHYAVEVARGNIEDHSLSRFLAYIFLFPTFTAGPIERMDHFLANRADAPTRLDFAEGLTRLMHGLIKKLILSDLVIRGGLMDGKTVDDLLRRLGTLPPYQVWGFLALSFLFMYLEFSAYSDIAIGASRLFGLRIMENFHWPILATNIGNFWKRWHMTLAGWCQAYVYMPMFGLTRNPYLAVLATMMAISLWHAGSLTYLGWGLYHAAGVLTYLSWTRFKRRRGWSSLDRMPALRLVGWAATLAFVSASTAFTTVYTHGTAYDSLRILGRLVALDLPPTPGLTGIID